MNKYHIHIIPNITRTLLLTSLSSFSFTNLNNPNVLRLNVSVLSAEMWTLVKKKRCFLILKKILII